MATRRTAPGPALGRARGAGVLLTVWLLLLGAVVLVGEALTGPLEGSVGVADGRAVRWVTGLRSSGLTELFQAVSLLGETWTELVLAPLSMLVVWWWLRRLRPLLFLALVGAGELALYLLAVNLVGRQRPEVQRLDSGLDPSHSFPSGHVAAAMATYGAMAVLIWVTTRSPHRWLALVLLAPAPLVAVARLYLGVHHPTDVLTSLAFVTVWLAALTVVVLRPERVSPAPTPRASPSRPGRAASREPRGTDR